MFGGIFADFKRFCAAADRFRAEFYLAGAA